MSRLPTLDSTRFIRALKRAGFVESGQLGSHLHLKNPQTGRRTVVPVHGGDLKRGLMKLIIKQAGLTERQFLKYL